MGPKQLPLHLRRRPWTQVQPWRWLGGLLTPHAQLEPHSMVAQAAGERYRQQNTTCAYPTASPRLTITLPESGSLGHAVASAQSLTHNTPWRNHPSVREHSAYSTWPLLTVVSSPRRRNRLPQSRLCRPGTALSPFLEGGLLTCPSELPGSAVPLHSWPTDPANRGAGR